MNKNHGQNVDKLIDGLKFITQNRCSLSDEDVVVVNQAIEELQKFKASGKFELRDLVDVLRNVVELLLKVFLLNHEIANLFQHLH